LTALPLSCCCRQRTPSLRVPLLRRLLLLLLRLAVALTALVVGRS
jgi:hypothetical protein